MRHLIGLFISLLALWCLLSGMYQPLLLALGAASCAFVTWIVWRKDVIDHESVPLHIKWGRIFGYWIWLLGQIIKANIDVARVIWNPSMPISPTVIRVPARMNPVAKVIYANSITLTPGTVSIEVDENEIEVHALTRAGADDLLTGEMGRRVAALEDAEA